jgi:hypothetical protein
MLRHTCFAKRILLAAAGFAAIASFPARAADGGIRQQPLNPGVAGGRVPVGPAPRTTRPDPATDDGLSRLRRIPDDDAGQNSAAIRFRGTQYVVTDGQWYERRGRDLVAVSPPSGVLVRDLPKDHTMRWIGGVPYFYADGLYYVWREGARRYEILQAPPSGDEAGTPDKRRESAP